MHVQTVRTSRVRCVSTAKTYPLYKSTIAISFNLVTALGPSIVRVAGYNNAPTENAKREPLRSKRLIKMLFWPKITAFHLIMWVESVPSTPCVKYIRTFRKLSAIYICEV